MIGMNIKQLRQEKHIKQETLADAIGVSAQAVSKWETGASEPDIALLPKLAGFFGVSIDELFDLTQEQKLRRIENRMDMEAELPKDVFQEYEEFLSEQLSHTGEKARILSLLAHL